MGYCLRKAGSLSYGDAAVAEAAGTFTQRILSFTVKFKQRCVVWALFSILQLLFGETVFRHLQKKEESVFLFSDPPPSQENARSICGPPIGHEKFSKVIIVVFSPRFPSS